METVIIDCRRTGQGAETCVVQNWGAEIEQFDFSKTGNHWKEKITFPNASAYTLVRDVSNSGKHYCYYAHSDGHKEEITSVPCECGAS